MTGLNTFVKYGTPRISQLKIDTFLTDVIFYLPKPQKDVIEYTVDNFRKGLLSQAGANTKTGLAFSLAKCTNIKTNIIPL